jgi:Na+-driven multidrug efflux pump
MLLSIGFCVAMCLLVNIFPTAFFGLFGQGPAFVKQGIPVLRVVSIGLMVMSIANIWLNGVTGTAKTRVNLFIEIIAITVYLVYTWYFIKLNYISLAMAWSNEVVYWFTIFIMSFIYLRSGRWKTK